MLILSLIASLDSLPTLIWWYQIFFFERKSNLLWCWLIPWVHCYIYLNWHYSFIRFFFLLKHQLLSSLLCTLSLPAALQCIQPSFGGRVEKGREFGREGRGGGVCGLDGSNRCYIRSTYTFLLLVVKWITILLFFSAMMGYPWPPCPKEKCD